MLLQTWGYILTRSFQELWIGIVGFVPNILVAIIIFVVGWIVAVLLGRVVAHAIGALKLDNALKSANVDEILGRAGFRLDSGRFLGELVKWFVIVVFLVATLDVLKLTQVNAFLQNVVLAYLPQVIAAALILLIAAVIAQALRKVVIGAAKAANIELAIALGLAFGLGGQEAAARMLEKMRKDLVH
ncbi:MAG: hypothetical protein HYT29_00575 [Parcubacteria group bacterium]|nr:hypothetical protein [Parcubacteria group bacterium]